MSKSTVLIVIGGFVFAFLAAVGVQLMMGGGKSTKDVQAKTVQILAASQDIKMGEAFAANNMRWETWPEETMVQGAIVRKDKELAAEVLKGKAKRDFAKGEPLLENASVDDTGKSFVTASIEPGMRAMAIKVTAQSSVAGLAVAGDRVDVVVKYDIRLPANDRIKASALPVVTRSVAETVVEDVRVLAVDQNTKRPNDPKVGKTVTLEVSPRQAEVLQVADGMGDLILSLRGGVDAGKGQASRTDKTTTDVRVSRLMQEIMGNSEAAPSRAVRVYQGNVVQNVQVAP